MTPHRTLPRPFGHYHIGRMLGRGGMAAVYEAEDTRLSCRLALKVCHAGADSPKAIERFHREARFAQRIHHPFVCPVYESGELDGIHYLTMPLIEGASLERRSGPVAAWQPGAAAELIRRLALALQAVHDAGVVHRDLKPHNVMIRPTGEPVLMDFGLARDMTGFEEGLTAPGTAIGTIQFIAPEQIRGDLDDVGPTADVYSLGIILYQLLCGALPFDYSSTADLYRRILTEPPPRPSAVRPGVDPRLEEICLKSLSKDVSARYPTMTAFAEALTNFQGRPNAEPPPTTPRPTRTAPTPGSGPVEVNVAGTWHALSVTQPNASWERVATTPGMVPYDVGMVYQLVVDPSAKDTNLTKLAALAGLTTLHTLDLSRCESITPSGLAPVGALTQLKSLSLTRGGAGGVALNDEGAKNLAELSGLEEFRARLTEVADFGLAKLTGLTALLRAELYDCGMLTDAGLGLLVRLTKLEHLTLGGCGMSDLGIRRIATLRSLVSLTLEDCSRITGVGLALLRGLDRLRSFTLSGGSRIGDDALPALATLSSLLRLEIRGCRITDEGLAGLSRSTLRALTLSQCPRITAAGLVHLQPIGLESLEIVGCERIAADAIEKFQRESPRCKVEFRRA